MAKSSFPRKLTVDYGYSCGRAWVQIGDKEIYQAPGADLPMLNETVEEIIELLKTMERIVE